MSYLQIEFPSLTVAIPSYNESSNIERVIRSFLSTKYLNLIEILIADGGSTDGTQDIVQKLSLEDFRVKLLHNHLKVQSAGLNLILEEARGDIFLRADAHSDYAPDYIEKCVEALIESHALNAGGAQRFAAKTSFQAGIALASKSLLGSGGAKYRDFEYNGYAETVYLGCFWTKALRRLSGYCIEATPNEDSELNLRLRKFYFDNIQIKNQDEQLNNISLNEKNKAIYVSSKVRVWYYPRKTWKSLCIQYFKYGRGRYLTNTKHSNEFLTRGNLPFLAISSLFIMLFFDFLFPNFELPIVELTLFGILLPVLESFRITWKFRNNFASEIWRGSEEKIPSFLNQCFFCGVTLLTMPIAHFCGYSFQLFRYKVLRVSSW